MLEPDLKAQVVRVHSPVDGSVKTIPMKAGPGDFVVCTMEDGSVLETQVPNIALLLPRLVAKRPASRVQKRPAGKRGKVDIDEDDTEAETVAYDDEEQVDAVVADGEPVPVEVSGEEEPGAPEEETRMSVSSQLG